jgi:hypothetical protein
MKLALLHEEVISEIDWGALLKRIDDFTFDKEGKIEKLLANYQKASRKLDAGKRKKLANDCAKKLKALGIDNALTQCVKRIEPEPVF